MLSRQILNASRVASKRVIAPATQSSVRTFKTVQSQQNAEEIKAGKVLTVTYKDGVRQEVEIPVEQNSGPVAPPGADDKKAAIPLDKSILGQLNPTMSKFTLPGKVAVVTGGGRGLGFNMAQALAEVGVRGIAIMDVQQKVGEEAARELSEQTGVDVRFYQVDVRDGSAINQAVGDIVDHYGQIDILLNSAGIADSNIKAETYDTEMFRRLIDINLTGAFLVAQAVGKQMIASKNGGSIILVASMSGSIVNYPQEQSCYNASKAGVIQLTKSLATEWARHGIRVNSISPGYMDTALNRVPALDAQKKIWIENTPQKRLGAVDDLNNLAVYLASPASAFMTGSNCIIDGGYTLW
ncbi:Sorbose reductase sou1 [Lasiodiplodia hormozganensis]|uniref:NADP-dependent mannitol dehydrogenase n=1 Tax=Lasiodiplodia hormozganensis TaxID=869390 RepID=A0AA40CTG9_9PEZI|nr:Sorbose reductase sou1 [Lasiodiplodia hormozganensis]